MTDAERFERLVDTARSDDAILGLILYGSRGAGVFVRDDSDWDVWLTIRDDVLTEYETRYDTEHGARLEVGTDTLDGLRRHGERGTSHAWNRYAFRHALVLVDKLKGEIGRIVDRKRTLSAAEAPIIAEAALDAYVNGTYRSLKAARLGQAVGSHMDASDAMGYLIEALFAFTGRVRPWSKYLRWELESEPIPGETWQADALLDRLDQLLSNPTPEIQQRLFRDVEELARVEGYGRIIDSWGPSLNLLRG